MNLLSNVKIRMCCIILYKNFFSPGLYPYNAWSDLSVLKPMTDPYVNK